MESMLARPVRHTIVISDVHLSEAEPGEAAWLRYRQRRFFPDEALVRLRQIIAHRLGVGDRLEMVFDGDVFEFEAPRVIDGKSRFTDAPRSEEEAVEMMARVMRDHEIFFRAVAGIVADGHHVVFIAGNHDAQLALPAVKEHLRNAVLALAPADADGVDPRHVSVVPWFFQTDDGIHVEHGHQYDAYCSFRDPLHPLDVRGREIQPTVGSLAFRHLISRMGFFNAYDERSFLLSVPSYFGHWARYYLFSRRSLALTWFLGALKVVSKLLRSRPKAEVLAAIRDQAASSRAAYAKLLTLDARAITKHAELFAEPADADPQRVVRELRLDHAALAVVGVAGLVTAAFKPKLGLFMALGALAAGVAYELIAPRRPLHDEYEQIDDVARSIAKIYDARAVVFGHTHIPHAEVQDGVIYANSGSWAPPVDETDLESDNPPGKPVVWLRRPEGARDGKVEGGLYRLKDGALLPDIAVSTHEVDETDEGDETDVAGVLGPALALRKT